MKKIFVLCVSLIAIALALKFALSEDKSINAVQAEEILLNVENMRNYIGKDIDELTRIYGQPSSVVSLYGTSIYYYSDDAIGFGVDVDVVTSLLIYKGKLKNGLTIGMNREDVNNILKDERITGQDEVIDFVYEDLEGYLQFEDDKLVEIFFK